MEGIRAVKAVQGVKDYDFKGPEKRLTYPWAKGLKADEIVS